MKKVLLVVLVLLMAVALFGCNKIAVSDTLPPETTKKPSEQNPEDTTPVTTVDTEIVIIDDTYYHLTGLLESSVSDENGFVFDVFENGAALVGYEGSSESVEVPDKFGDKNVTLIGKRAFKSNLGIKSVTLPEGIQCIGDEAFYNCRNLSSVNVPSSVTKLGSGVFSYCDGIKTVALPEGLEEIGTRLFFGCSSLENAAFPDKIKTVPSETFDHCVSLKSFTFASGTTLIGAKAFNCCTLLSEISLPDTIESIGECAFYGCKSMPSVNITDKITKIEREAFFNCASLKEVDLESVETISEYAFYGCSSLENVKTSNALKTLESGAFAGCLKITKFEIPATIKKIASFLFYGCESLSDLKFAVDITEIGKYALAGTAIPSIHIPATVTSLGGNLFSECSKLNNVTFGTSYVDYIFYIAVDQSLATETQKADAASIARFRAALEKYDGGFVSTQNITEKVTGENGKPINETHVAITYHVTDEEYEEMKVLAEPYVYIKEGIKKESARLDKKAALTKIDEKVFASCTALTKIVLPESITVIGKNSFDGCENLAEVVLSKSVYKIENDAFLNCKSLLSIEVPDTVTDIGKSSMGMIEVTIVNENTGKSIVEKQVLEGFILKGFSGGAAHSYASSNNVPFGSIGLTGCIPYGDLIYAPVDASATIENKAYVIKGYNGEGTVGAIPEYIAETYTDGEGNEKTAKVPFVEIEDSVFENNNNFLSITIPAGIRKIGERAFAGCSSVTALTIAASTAETVYGENAFEGLAITEVTLPEGLVSIPANLFKGCASLKSVNIPAAINSIGDYAFAGTAIESAIVVPDTVVSIGKEAFAGTSIKELTVPFIGGSLNENCVLSYIFGETVPEALAKVTVSDVATSVAEGAFRDCKGLTGVVLGSGIKSIGDYAFAGCESLKGAVELKGKAPAIADGATHIFEGASNAAYFKFPGQYEAEYTIETTAEGFNLWKGYRATSATNKAFYTANINGIDISITYNGAMTMKGNADLPDYSLDNLPVWSKYSEAIVTLKITSLTRIGDYAFYGCSSLTTLEIPSTVKSLGAHSFENCPNVKKLTISGAIEVPDYAFAGMTALDTLSMTKVTKIGAHAFEGSGLRNIKFAATVTEIGEYAFADSAYLTSVAYTGDAAAVKVAENAFDNTPFATK